MPGEHSWSHCKWAATHHKLTNHSLFFLSLFTWGAKLALLGSLLSCMHFYTPSHLSAKQILLGSLHLLLAKAHTHDTHPFFFPNTHLHSLSFIFPNTHLYTPLTISQFTPSKPHPCGIRSLAGARVDTKIEKSMVQIPLLSLSFLFAVRGLLSSMPQFRHRDSNPGRSGEGRVS